MLLAAGGAVDFTRYYDAQQNVQTALDAATLAGAAVYDGSNDSTSVDTADKTFSAWSTAFNGSISDPTFTPTSDSDALYVTGSTQVSLNMYFTGIIGLKTLNFTVTSKAERLAGSTSSGSSSCIWWRTSKTNIDGTVDAESCQVNLLSAVSTMDTEATITTPKFCYAGNNDDSELRSTIVDSDGNDSLEKNCTAPDYHQDVPTVTVPTSCADSSVYSAFQNLNGKDVTVPSENYCSSFDMNGGQTDIYPGTYSGLTIKSGTIVFHPGLYIINGNWTFEGGSYSGTGVTFYLTSSGSITFNSSGTFNLSAPTSSDCGTYNDVDTCDYKNILLFESDDDSGSDEITLDSGNSFTLSGLIYLPNRYVNYNSTASVTHSGGLVAKTMFLGASSKWVEDSSGTTTTTSEYGPPRLVK